ncbi:innate immunity activator protein [Erpetoichthys calabaricus]|uniref:Innate immunity activator a n=1 Tax=Erpetoichthys calabaricus TaxID=27687 RepID=A0A8C4SPZ3_ERPCA|nr:innate immunity activator protein [Erpetoichthys calabaricus]XP_028653911.1 innate immunity activator protein [Erpetoichthys calabaricus]XP_051780279.1 innate immunity activator protein [Erpetoichthys calabaricus]
MEGKEETSDTDSGIILQSGPDSPLSPMKDLTAITKAVKLRQVALEEKLKACLMELKNLCVREAELTGKLPKDFPLEPGEKPPTIRRRIGAAFKLDEHSIKRGGEDPVLSSLEADLALQRQIYEAARRLSLEENISKQIKKNRINQCKREEKKLKDLQQAVNEYRLKEGCTPLLMADKLSEGTNISDDSSLSDVAILEEDEGHLSSHIPGSRNNSPMRPVPRYSSPVPTPHPPQTLEGLKQGLYCPSQYERAPIQNTAWHESSLDQPYQKTKKASSSTASSQTSSPCLTPVLTPVEGQHELSIALPLTPFKNLSLQQVGSTSAPSTPEIQGRRGHSQSMRLTNADPSQDSPELRGRSRLPRRRPTNYTVTSPEYSSPLPRVTMSNPIYYSSSEDSNSEHSVPSYTSSPCREALPEFCKPSPPPYPGPPVLNNGQKVQFFYRNRQNQSSPNFLRPYNCGEGCLNAFQGDCDNSFPQERLYTKARTPSPSWDQHLYGDAYYEEERMPQGMPRAIPTHVRLGRTPSLREYPQNGARVLARDLVSEELKSWHERSRFRNRRPHSLDRQGAIKLRSAPGHESPLTRRPTYHSHQHQVPQRLILHRAPDGTPIQWYEEEDAEIVSQV